MQDRVSKSLLLSGSIIAGMGVLLGAFGAHGLKNIVAPAMLNTFETAVRYQMYHAFGLLVAGLACRAHDPNLSHLFKTAGWLFAVGVILFSGSLYSLVLANMPWLGAITPFGGISFACGWFVLVFAFSKSM